MSIKKSNLVHAEVIDQPADRPPKIRLRNFDGRTLEVTGAVLEAQFTDGKNQILFVTEDSPFEEALHIFLVGPNFELVDSIELSASYTPGILKIIEVIQADKITFSFFCLEEIWSLVLLEKPVVKLWGNSHPIKRQSPFLHQAWLLLEKS